MDDSNVRFRQVPAVFFDTSAHILIRKGRGDQKGLLHKGILSTINTVSTNPFSLLGIP